MVSIIMSCFNAELFIENCINSVLNQTYKDLELIIIDDNSSDSTVELINRISDPRVKLYINSENLGLTKNLIKAISLSKGTYIARIDADDMFLKRKIATQVKFLEKNKDIGCIGTNAISVGRKGSIKMPKSDESIRALMVFSNPLIHPSILIRKEIIFNNQYNPDYRYSQDYELWSRIQHLTKFHNLQKNLVAYRYHKKQVSSTNNLEQKTFALKISSSLLEKIGLDDSEVNVISQSIYFPEINVDFVNLKNAFVKLIKNNAEKDLYKAKYFDAHALNYYYRSLYICRKNSEVFQNNKWKIKKAYFNKYYRRLKILFLIYQIRIVFDK